MSLYGAKRPAAEDAPTTEIRAVSWPGSAPGPTSAAPATGPVPAARAAVPPAGHLPDRPVPGGPVPGTPVLLPRTPQPAPGPAVPGPAAPGFAAGPGQPADGVPDPGLDQTDPAIDLATLGPRPAEPVRRRRPRRALVAGGLVAAVLLAVGGTAGYAYSGEVPRGTSVLGVELGGQSRAEAIARLRVELDRRADEFNAPVPVRLGDEETQVNPADVGLAIDVEATVAATVGTSRDPLDLLFNARTVDPVVTVDAERLDTELRKTVGRTGRPMKPASITFQGTTPRVVHPQPGQDLDPARSAEALRTGWLDGRTVVIPLVEAQPVTTAAEVDRLVEELAKPAVAAPVTVTTDRGTFSIPPAAIAKSLVFAADKTGKITPLVDEKKLHAALTTQLAKVELKPKEATLNIAGGKPQVVASSGGQAVDTAALSRDLLPVLPKQDGREVKGVLKEIKPKTTTEDLSTLGVKEQVSTFTTKFTGGLASPRSKNIVQAAKQVDGTLVKPGETFSLNKHTGERGYAQGYHDAPVILDGKLVPGVGGGVSQFTTTLFNATYYAGLEDVEHKPHSYYFDRYPSVIESTIFYPDLDFKFKNNTEYGVLLDTSYTNNSITVSVWSTKIWDSVTTSWGPRRNITKPKLIYLEPGPKCIATSGIDGFAQDAWRIFRKDGKEVKREKFSWRYDAEPRYVCAKQPR